MGNLETRAEQYYQQKKTSFNRITNEWTSLSREFPEKLKSLIISGFTSSVSSSRDEGSPYSVRVGVSISANTDSANEYAGRVQKQIERIKQDFETNVQDMDKTMDGYKQEGLDSDLLAKLISLLKQWVDYIATMKMDVSSHVITVETDPKLVAIRKKWDDYGNVAMRQAEAKRFGVELADLDKHKRYLEGKQKKAAARTSAVMEQAYRILSGVGSYLDADKLAKEAKEQW